MRIEAFDKFLAQPYSIQTVKLYATNQEGEEVVTCVPFNELMILMAGASYDHARMHVEAATETTEGEAIMPELNVNLITRMAQQQAAVFIEAANQHIVGIDGAFKSADTGEDIHVDMWKTNTEGDDSYE